MTAQAAEPDPAAAAARAGFEDASRIVAAQYSAGVDISQIAAHHEDLSAHLLNDAQTPVGRAYGREYGDASRSLIADLRADAAAATRQLPGPGEPHPDRPGWEGCKDGCGVYVYRRAERGADRLAEADREAV
jgi:hypothetical protein